MKKTLFGLALPILMLSCTGSTDINNTSWVTEQGNISVVMSFKSQDVQITINDGDKKVGETIGTYSIVNDTIRIGDADSYDKAIVEGSELIYFEDGGVTKFKKLSK